MARARLLQAHNLRVVTVPYSEWGNLHSDYAKQAYLDSNISRAR